jgi:hypothetical protein
MFPRRISDANANVHSQNSPNDSGTFAQIALLDSFSKFKDINFGDTIRKRNKIEFVFTAVGLFC